MSAAVSLRPSIATRMARQDAPTVRVPPMPKPLSIEILSPEAVAKALDDLECETSVRVFDGHLHVSDLIALTPWDAICKYRDEAEHSLRGRRITLVMGCKAYRCDVDDADVMPTPVEVVWCPACGGEHGWCL